MSATPHPACSQSAFEARYRRAGDPWNFARSAYERGRYRATMAALTRGWYERAFEPACSVGELTVQLARRCGQVMATDLAPSAVGRARRRCHEYANVEVSQADLANGSPPGPFDLIVFSECGYYFDAASLRAIARDLEGILRCGGEFLAVHWLGDSADHVLHGDTVHELLYAELSLQWIQGARHPGYRIDTWKRP